MNFSLEQIIEDIDELLKTHIEVRSHFPYVGQELLGTDKIPSKSFYDLHGFSIEINLSDKITPEIREKFNERSHWLNQNLIVRLYALLNRYQFVGENEIDKSAQGSDEVDIVRRLRNIFAHSSGKFKIKNKDHRKLRKKMVNKYSIDESYNEFPLSIDKVIVPLFEGCKKYVIAMYGKIYG